MCDKVVSKEPFMLKHCPNRYKTQKMYDKKVDACVSALKFAPDCLATSKMLEMLNDVLFSNDDIDSDIPTFFRDDTGINNIDLNNINRNGDNFDEADPETIIHVRLMAWCNKYKQRKTFKKKLSK